MDEKSFPIDISPLRVTATEVSLMKEVEKQHENLLLQSEEMTSADISPVIDFLKSLSEAGADIRNPDYRSQLRALIRYWISFIGDKTSVLPVVQLQPFISAQAEDMNPSEIMEDVTNEREKGKTFEVKIESSIPPDLFSRTNAIKNLQDCKDLLKNIRNLLLYELDLRILKKSDIDILQTILRKIITEIESLQRGSSQKKPLTSAFVLQEKLANAVNSLYLASDLLEEGKTIEDRKWLYQTFEDCQQLLLDAIDQFPIGES